MLSTVAVEENTSSEAVIADSSARWVLMPMWARVGSPSSPYCSSSS